MQQCASRNRIPEGGDSRKWTETNVEKLDCRGRLKRGAHQSSEGLLWREGGTRCQATDYTATIHFSREEGLDGELMGRMIRGSELEGAL